MGQILVCTVHFFGKRGHYYKKKHRVQGIKGAPLEITEIRKLERTPTKSINSPKQQN